MTTGEFAGQAPGENPEARFSHFSDYEVALGYRAGEVPGTVVMGRLLHKLGLPPDAADLDLIGRGGETFIHPGEGRPYRVGEYLSVAKDYEHGRAEELIVKFVGVPETHPSYPIVAGIMRETVLGYLPPDYVAGLQG